MSGGGSINSGTGTGGARIDFNYNASTSASTSGSDNHVIGIDDELWDIVEEGVQFENMDGDGVVIIANRKLFTEEQKKQYKKHNKVKSILTKSISHSEYLKISNKSSAKFIWDSLCSTYEGNEQVRKPKQISWFINMRCLR
ncbi:aspartyl-tRNA synthetase [Trifolium medium]|uniref:Aspartyl-tRNA synthetase n=1 Tax=Trifolium medium TaxID=97028 RepID=A0A392QI47_9FABA|nr:aspartyl-tRNA synthetase [Trifolium medium]